MAQVTFSGPIKSGSATSARDNLGTPVLVQRATVLHTDEGTAKKVASFAEKDTIEIIDIKTDLVTPFDAVTSNLFDIGTSSDDDAYAESLDVEVAAGRLSPTLITANLQTDTDGIYVLYTGAGEGMEDGSANVIVEYIQT